MYLKSYDSFMFKVNQLDPLKVDENNTRYHFEKTLQPLTKFFTDSTSEQFKTCNPFSPILAWASQFCILVIDAKQENAYA